MAKGKKKKPYREQMNPATVARAKMADPDYSAGCGHFGCKLVDIFPQPHIRKYPNQVTKRKVRASIHDFKMAFGQHYYTSLCEEDNPVWEGRYTIPGNIYHNGPHWVRPWHDDDGKGRHESGRFDTYTEAVAWIDTEGPKMFPPETHVIEREYLDTYEDEEKARLSAIGTTAKIKQYVRKGD